MFSFSINNVLVIFSKFFAPTDLEQVVAAVPEGAKRVVFIDTPATSNLVATVEDLLARGVEVVVRDHHDVPNPRNPREQEIATAAGRVRELVGGGATISNRQANPACSSLITLGEFFAEGTVIVADNDPDGLTAAMKAVGLSYEGLDSDAAVLDGARSEQTAERLTPLALLLVKGLSTLPSYDANRPQVAEEAKGKLFAEFVAAASGDQASLDSLNRKVEAYEAGVRVAEEIAATATEPVPGVDMVDTVGKPRHDLVTLTGRLEARPGCRITVVRKDSGPIAAKHGGVQVSLAVAKSHQVSEKNPGGLNLQDLLPAELFGLSDEEKVGRGCISNTSFLLHVSEQVWNEVILPALRMRLQGVQNPALGGLWADNLRRFGQVNPDDWGR